MFIDTYLLEVHGKFFSLSLIHRYTYILSIEEKNSTCNICVFDTLVSTTQILHAASLCMSFLYHTMMRRLCVRAEIALNHEKTEYALFSVYIYMAVKKQVHM